MSIFRRTYKDKSGMNATDLARWVTERKAAGKSAANCNHHIRKLKAFGNWLQAVKRLTENPFALPLREDLARDLKDYLALHLPAARLFTNMQKGRGAAMLRVDLEAAGIPYVDEYGLVADFHALRHSFASLLNQAGVPLVTAQQLMRHSDPRLTSNVYTHVMVEGKAEALAKLPDFSYAGLGKESAALTGTDDSSTSGNSRIIVSQFDSNGTNLGAEIRTYRDSAKTSKPHSNPTPETAKTPVSQGFLAEREGFEPSIQVTPYDGLASRCIRPLCHLSVCWRQ